MADPSPPAPSPPNPNHLVPPAHPGDPPLPPPLGPDPQPRLLFPFPKRPSIRVTSEYDSDSSIFFNKVSCKLFDSLAKLKLSFQNNSKGEIAEPQVAFSSKHLSTHYDVEEQNALIRSSFDVGPRLHLRATHDVKVRSLLVEETARGWRRSEAGGGR